MNHLPIWRDANRLLLAIEQAVRQFPRYHKYTLGTDLRRQAMQVCRLIRRAAERGEDQHQRVARVVEAVDDLKLQIQLGNRLALFGEDLERALESAPWIGRWRQGRAEWRRGLGGGRSWPLGHLKGLGRSLRRAGRPYCFIGEEGYLPGGMKRRTLRYLFAGRGADLITRQAETSCPPHLVH